jgi:hypothetical protein
MPLEERVRSGSLGSDMAAPEHASQVVLKRYADCLNTNQQQKPRVTSGFTGRGAAWSAHLLWEQEIVGSNPTVPTIERHWRRTAACRHPLNRGAERNGRQPTLLRTEAQRSVTP